MRTKKSYYVFLLKAALVVLSLWVIQHQVAGRDDFRETLERFGRHWNSARSLWTGALLLAMMAANWLLEALKWRYLVRPVQAVGILRSAAAVLSGITISFFTPNRIGEYAGRVLLLEQRKRIKGVVATVVGSMNQLLVTVFAGTIALMAILRASMPADRPLYLVTTFILGSGLVFIVLAYFNLSGFYRRLSRVSWLKRLERYFRVLTHYHRHELAFVTALSLLRYIVFTGQFMLLLNLFGVTVDFVTAGRQIALGFLIMSVVPTFALTELTIRGSVALYCLQPFSDNTAGIVAASFSLWFLNLVLPAVAGAFCLLFVKPFKREAG